MDEDGRERDRLQGAIVRSRALRQAGRVAAAAGFLWLGALALSLLSFTPAAMVAAVALGVGGVVLAGSSATTTLELEAALTALDARRANGSGAGDKVVSLFGPGSRARRTRPRP